MKSMGSTTARHLEPGTVILSPGGSRALVLENERALKNEMVVGKPEAWSVHVSCIKYRWLEERWEGKESWSSPRALSRWSLQGDRYRCAFKLSGSGCKVRVVCGVPSKWSAGEILAALLVRVEDVDDVEALGATDDFPCLEWANDGEPALSLADLW